MRRGITAAPASLETLLDREVEAFDQVMSEVRNGVRGPAHYDELEERVTTIASGMRAAFRKAARA
jgi:hypothetical protein